MANSLKKFNDDTSRSSRTSISVPCKQALHHLYWRKNDWPIQSSFIQHLHAVQFISTFSKAVIRASISTFNRHFYSSFVKIVKQPSLSYGTSVCTFGKLIRTTTKFSHHRYLLHHFKHFEKHCQVLYKRLVTMVPTIIIGCYLVRALKLTDHW